MRRCSLRAKQVALVLLVATVCGAPSARAEEPYRVELPLIVRVSALLPSPLLANCTRVVDGDTIVVIYESSLELDLRYIGVNTPENDGNECFNDEATERNRELVSGKHILFQRDIRYKDSWNRFLGYVYVDGLFVNEVLIVEGYGLADAHDPDVTYAGRLMRAECEARAAGRGLWGECQIKPDVEREAPGDIALTHFVWTGEDESIRVSNTGGTAIDMTDWTLVSAVGGERFSFTDADALDDGDVLPPYHSIYIHSGPDTSLGELGVRWRRSRAWNDAGDEARLFDAAGQLVDAWPYGDQVP